MTKPNYAWRQPICGMCWRLRNPGKTAPRVTTRECEVCCDCGSPTTSGIYFRIDPACAKHPTLTR